MSDHTLQHPIFMQKISQMINLPKVIVSYSKHLVSTTWAYFSRTRNMLVCPPEEGPFTHNNL